MWFKIRIRQHERGLWFRHGDFRGLLGPGVHRFWSRLWNPRRDRIEIANTLVTKFEHALLEMFASNDDVRDALEIVDLSDAERALVWKDDRLAMILGPGRHALWRTPARLNVEVFDIGAGRFEHPRMAAIARHPQAAAFLEQIVVVRGWENVLFRDGKLADRLTEGTHVFWKSAANWLPRAIDLREQVLDVAGQEIMTADKVSVRANVVVVWRVTDAVTALTATSDVSQAVYRDAQLAVRAAVGTRTLDALLADKEAIGRELSAAMVARAAELGVAIRSIGLRDIVLPGDMRLLMNQVVEAEKQAQANLIRRREETAAARSQANTARLLAENPMLARMKEMELLKDVLFGVKATFVLGGGDLSEQVRSLIRTEAAASQNDVNTEKGGDRLT